MPEKIKLRAEYPAERLDVFLRDALLDLSRSQIEKLIKAGNVTLNGRVEKTKKTPVNTGDKIEIKLFEEKRIEIKGKLAKVYEDEQLLVIEKPGDLAVHPGAGERALTVLDLFRSEHPQLASFKDQERPGIVHRLDRETTGLLLLAKEEKAQAKLQKQFRQHTVEKRYFALVEGVPQAMSGKIELWMERNPKNPNFFVALREPAAENSRFSETRYRVLLRKDGVALLVLTPLTGRTHQIRAHLAAIGYPVLGDRFYNPKSKIPLSFLALHACFLAFNHPATKRRVSFRSFIPKAWHDFWNNSK